MLLMMIVVMAVMAVMIGPGNGPMGMMTGHEKTTHTEASPSGKSSNASDHYKDAAKVD